MLDPYEQRIYDDLTRKGMESNRVLEIMINSVEGDYSQLSKGLLAYAKERGLLT